MLSWETLQKVKLCSEDPVVGSMRVVAFLECQRTTQLVALEASGIWNILAGSVPGKARVEGLEGWWFRNSGSEPDITPPLPKVLNPKP